MNIAQRMIMVLVIIVFLVTGIDMVCKEKEEKIKIQWERMQTELFLQELCRNKYLGQNDYMIFAESLMHSKASSEISIEEYKKEQDLAGNIYYYFISWEELQESIWKEEGYFFEPGSVIRIKVEHQGKNKSVTNCYYGLITGEE